MSELSQWFKNSIIELSKINPIIAFRLNEKTDLFERFEYNMKIKYEKNFKEKFDEIIDTLKKKYIETAHNKSIKTIMVNCSTEVGFAKRSPQNF